MALFKRKKIKEKIEKKNKEIIAIEKQLGKEKNEEKEKKEANIINLSHSGSKLANEILIRPIITEKATNFSAFGKYLFEVSPKANKVAIKKAIESLYKVVPINVNTIKVKGKKIRYGKSQGRTKNWKKAIITLKKGQKIEFAEK